VEKKAPSFQNFPRIMQNIHVREESLISINIPTTGK
jgi:hypothetical protein